MPPRPFLFFRRITPRTTVWGLGIGFAVTVLLLGLAGIVAVRESRAIRTSSARVVAEHRVTAKLLHEVQVKENTLTEVLHQVVRSPHLADRGTLLRELDETDTTLARLAAQRRESVDAALWQDLLGASQEFSAEARLALARSVGADPVETDVLFVLYERVVGLTQKLLDHSAGHLAAADRQIETRYNDLADDSVALLGSCLVLASVCAIATVLFVRRSIRQIEWQSDELNHVSWHMLQTQEETARRFSHELHDELGQSLAALRANLTGRSQDNAEERRADCVRLVDESIANVREISQLLRPVILDDFGLDASLRSLAEKFGQRVGVKVRYRCNLEERLEPEIETHLYRIAQEALTNIARHADATEVGISLEQTAGRLFLIIEDNGCGIAQGRGESATSLGLTGMRARARECRGELSLEKTLPHGVRIVISVPVKPAC